jgi:hypothetical protein
MSYEADREQHQHQQIINKQRNSDVNLQAVRSQSILHPPTIFLQSRGTYKPESEPTLNHPTYSTMKVVSTSLALFLGAVLATTIAAAPGGLKKDGESASLHRSLQLDDSESSDASEAAAAA